MSETGGPDRNMEGSPAPPEEESAGTSGEQAPTEGTESTSPESAVTTGAEATDAEAAGVEATAPYSTDAAAAAAAATAVDDGDEGEPEEEESTNTWKWVALVLLFLFLAGLVVLLVLTRGDKVEVPDVKGLTLESATESLESAGLEVGEVAYLLQVESDAAPGTVAEQSPEAGSQVKEGGEVDLLVVMPNEVDVPNVVGLDVDEATEVLESLSLEVTTEEVDRAGATAGSVVEQSPASGTKVEPGSTVNLMVAAATTEATVPDVVGSTEQAATSKLESAGFSVSVEEVYDAEVGEGIVVSQRPQAGVTAAVGEEVTIVVSLGSSPQVTVPDVVGQAESAAVKALNDLGLEPVPSEAYSSTVPLGSVISQNPAGGTIVPQGSVVAIVVSLGAEPPTTVTVPDVLGKSKSEATSALESAGYEVVSADVYSDSVPAGTVGWQIPLGGSVTEPGISVAIIVSAGPRPPEFVTVPDVTDMTLEDATTEMEEAGLEVVAYEVHTSLAPAGQVVAQVPAPGSSVAPGSTVILIVSLGEATVMPQ